MPPFKRTITKFTGDADEAGRDMSRYSGEDVAIVGKAVRGQDDDAWIINVDGKRFTVEGDDLHPRADAKPTNEEFIAHLFQWSRTPMTHAFIFDAICKQADRVLADPDATRAAMADGMFGAETWMDAAREARDAVNAHLSPAR